MSRLIDGRAIAASIAARIARQAAELRARGTVPVLAVLTPTRDEEAAEYLRSLERAAAKAGITCQVHRLGETAGQVELADITEPDARRDIAEMLMELSLDPAVHGIMCLPPLPPGVDAAEVGASIAVAKDVDGANPASLGLIAAGVPGAFSSATAAAVLEILHHEQVPLSGKRVAVVGRSVVVGKPVALLLIAEHATVTVCNSQTRDLAAICREADIIVAAAGRAGLIGAGYVSPGTVVIDVGLSPATPGGFTGDVDLAAVGPIAAAISAAPGGVEPVTAIMLLQHTVNAALAAADAALAAAEN
jgi:methylenetetrahydrofolate dehydrogenase (NADP+) / methenyltetrahydrofolate cyclohydrolase